jgi:glycosyltransferase involved in cell wall biosynthesis
MKICVYAIAKNEAKHVKRFCDSASGADYIVIADTGSEDETIQIARDCGATVHSIAVTPWRFDTARNAALALVPADVDVCVSLDLDEVLEPGWREEIERVWTDGVTKMRHRFDFTGGHIYNAERIHARHGYYWKYPCHEFQVADSRITEQYANSDMVIMAHQPDKGKSRGLYMDMLEMAIKENPDCTRSIFYYARELFYYGRWADAIVQFEKYLKQPNATWNAERCYSLRIIGECYENSGDSRNAESFFLKACAEYPEVRDPWLSLARYYYKKKEWSECYGAIMRLLKITNRNYEYVALPDCWGHEPYDLAALACWNLHMRDDAVAYGQSALDRNPDDARLKDNLAWYIGDKSILEAAE